MIWSKSTSVLTEEFEDELYPDSDGKPLGETDYHIASLVYLREALQGFFRKVDIYVATDMFLYYEEGNVKARKAPDVMVVPGVDEHFRRSFKLWREAAGPKAIIELASRRTWKEDFKEKPKLYVRLAVDEYYIFDPENRLFDPPLMGFRRQGRRMLRRRLAADGSLMSKVMGLRLVPEGRLLRLIDPRNGKPLLTRDELAARAEAAEAKLERLRSEANGGARRR